MFTDDLDHLGDEIAELTAHLDAATHRLLTLIARFDESEGWGYQGALSCAHWLSWRVGLDLGAAREHVRVARALRELPQIDEALRRGQVSYSKVRALTRAATPENEAALLEMARCSSASQLERICRGYRLALRNAGGGRPDEDFELRWVRERETTAGMVRFDIQLRAEEAAALRQAMEAAASRAWRGERVSAGTRKERLRRADALVAVAEQYLSGQSEAPPVEIVVHVDAGSVGDVGGTLDDGMALPRATTDRLACDAAVVEVREDSRGNVLDLGRRRRTIPTMLRRALRLRDGGCRFPGCTNRFVDGHHVVPWVRGGVTALSNLCSLCRRHHTWVHEHGVRIASDDGVGFRFFDEHSREIERQAQPAAVYVDPIATLRARHADDGITVDAMTSIPNGDFRQPDYGVIVWSLLQGVPG